MTKRQGAKDTKHPYKYLIETLDRHGNVRLYYRRPGARRWVRLREKPGTVAFDAEYRAAVRGETPAVAGRTALPTRLGSLRWLIQQYCGSPEFLKLDASTRQVRRRILDRICGKAGDYLYAQMAPKDVAKLRNDHFINAKGKTTPEAANSIVKALRAVFTWAMMPEYGHAKNNPVVEVPYLKSNNPDGHEPWTEEIIQKFENRHPLGTKARLALDLFLYSGQRISDVVRLGPQMERDGKLCFTEFKGRNRKAKHHQLRILPPLRASIDAYYAAGNPRHLVYLATRAGAQHSVKGLGNWFARQCRMAGIGPGYSPHGIRKFGAIRALENGASAVDLQAVFGWDTLKNPDLYTRKANRAKVEASAIAYLDRENTSETNDADTVALLPAMASGATNRAKKL